MSFSKRWSKELVTEGGNYATAPRTAKRYTAICEVFVTTFGEQRPEDSVESTDISDFSDSRLVDYGIAKKTVGLELIAICSLFHYAVEKKIVAANPAVGISVKQTKAEQRREKRLKKRRPPKHEEADRICKKFPANHGRFTAEDFQDYAMFARYTGMRQGEIADVRVEDFRVYPEGNTIDAIIKNPESHGKPYKDRNPKNYMLCIFVADRESEAMKTGLERVVSVAKKLLPVVNRRNFSDQAWRHISVCGQGQRCDHSAGSG